MEGAADDTTTNGGDWPIFKPKTNSSVDTSRPFTSVKEAVAIFGERILDPGIYHSTLPPPPPTTTSPSSWKSASTSASASASVSASASASVSASASASPFNYSSSGPNYRSPTQRDNDHDQTSNDDVSLVMESPDEESSRILESVKRLEAELEETKAELKKLKERGWETEVALASLNAELHKNMSKLAQAEADVARKAAAEMAAVNSSPTLAQILNLGGEVESSGYYSNFRWDDKKKKSGKVKKEKPIVPLVGDLLWKKKKTKKKSDYDHKNPQYGSPMIF